MFINHLLTIAKTIFGKKTPRDSISNCFIVLSVHYRKIVKKLLNINTCVYCTLYLKKLKVYPYTSSSKWVHLFISLDAWKRL